MAFRDRVATAHLRPRRAPSAAAAAGRPRLGGVPGSSPGRGRRLPPGRLPAGRLPPGRLPAGRPSWKLEAGPPLPPEYPGELWGAAALRGPPRAAGKGAGAPGGERRREFALVNLTHDMRFLRVAERNGASPPPPKRLEESVSHGAMREPHLAVAFHKVRGTTAAFPAGLAGSAGAGGSAQLRGCRPLAPALRSGRSGGAPPPAPAPRPRPPAPRWGGGGGSLRSGDPRSQGEARAAGAAALLAAPSATTRVPPLRPLAGGADSPQTAPRTPGGVGGRQRSRRQRRAAPAAPAPAGAGHTPPLPAPSPPRGSRCLPAAAAPAPLPRAGGRAPACPRRRRAALRTPGAAPGPSLPAAERPLPRPCASAGAGAGRGAAAAREEG